MNISHIKYFTIFVIIALFVSFCVVQRSPVTGSKRAYGYTWEEEVKLGKQADQQIQQQYGVYEDEELQSYIEKVGQDVLEESHMRREDTDEKYRETEFSFKILNSPIANAFALPGGFIYVTRGMLAHMENEAQLAVVLGHEIAHVAARHASQRAFEQQMGQLALIGGAVAGQELLGVPGQDILQLGSAATQFLFLKYSRDDERESDRLGVEYAAMSNYDAADGAGFFSALERISEQAGQDIPTWQSSHPNPSERAETIPELAQKWREKGYEQNIEDTEEYMNKIDGLIYGENPREGFAEDGMFYHPDLKFQFSYPSGWEIINQPTLVATISESEDAVSIMQIDSEAESPKASVANYVSQEGFNVETQNATRANGLEAHEAIASAVDEEGNEFRFYVFAVNYGENIYRFVSYTLADRFSDYQRHFEETSNSFKSLTNQRILNVEPIRLQTMKADHSGTISSFLPNNLPENMSEEDIAIVNQVEVDETIEPGSWIKIPENGSF